MRAAVLLPTCLLAASLVLAGCVSDERPEESTAAPDGFEEPTSTPSPTAATEAPIPTTAPTPAAPAQGPAPAEATPAAPSPAPAPPPTTPSPVAPAPAPTPAPTPTPPPTAAPTPPPASAPPQAEPEPAQWPREGSHVTVRGSAGESAGDHSNQSEWEARWTFTNGDWRGTCEGMYTETQGGDERRDGFQRALVPSNPPHWPLFNTKTPPAQGAEVEVWVMWGCDIRSSAMVYSGTEVRPWGEAHKADDTPDAEANYSDFDTWWDPDTGLVMEWDWGRLHSGTSGRVVSTDAPV